MVRKKNLSCCPIKNCPPISSHIHCEFVQLKFSVVSILLSSLSGFGVTVGAHALFVEYLRWRERRNNRHERQRNNGSQQPSSENGVEGEEVEEDTQQQESVSYVANRSAS